MSSSRQRLLDIVGVQGRGEALEALDVELERGGVEELHGEGSGNSDAAAHGCPSKIWEKVRKRRGKIQNRK